MSQASLRFYGFEMLALVGPNHRNGLLVVHDAEQNGYQGGRKILVDAGRQSRCNAVAHLERN